MMSAEERYQSDPTFKMLVDMCYAAIESKQYTPSELRDAAMLAALRYDAHHVRFPRWMDGDYPRRPTDTTGVPK